MIDFPDDVFQPTDSKIVLLVVDGLGGIPHPDTGMSELETANLPNLDRLAQRSAAGVTTPVAPGVTPGSGPGHTALFGYDPLKYTVGRGVLEALGIGVELAEGDVAVRGTSARSTTLARWSTGGRAASRPQRAHRWPPCWTRSTYPASSLPSTRARTTASSYSCGARAWARTCVTPSRDPLA